MTEATDGDFIRAGKEFEEEINKAPALKKGNGPQRVYSPKLWKAMNMAIAAHDGQTRRTGIPYIVHPLTLMETLTHVGIHDEDTLIVALLHDIFEDTPDEEQRDVLKMKVKTEFGESVYDDVEALSFYGHSEGAKELYLESFKNKSVRANVVKAIDRVLNTRDFMVDDYPRARAYWDKASTFYNTLRDVYLDKVGEVYGEEALMSFIEIIEAIYRHFSVSAMMKQIKKGMVDGSIEIKRIDIEPEDNDSSDED